MNLYNMDRADGTHLYSALQQGVETPCYNINQAYGFWNDHKLVVFWKYSLGTGSIKPTAFGRRCLAEKDMIRPVVSIISCHYDHDSYRN